MAHGSALSGPESMTLMPWLTLAQLPDDDLRAIYLFVRSVASVTHAVELHPGFDPKPPRLLVSEVGK